MGGRNYNYQIPREGSHIHGSRCNTWKHWKTFSQNKHCCHFWWLRPTVRKGEQQHKSDSSRSTLHISHFQKSTHKIINKVKTPLIESIVEVQFKTGVTLLVQHVTWQRTLPWRKLYHRQLFATFFLKKKVVWKLPCTEHWTPWHYTIKITQLQLLYHRSYYLLHRLHILYLYFITYLFPTNFAQWQYVLFIGVLIFAQVNFCPSLEGIILMRF